MSNAAAIAKLPDSPPPGLTLGKAWDLMKRLKAKNDKFERQEAENTTLSERATVGALEGVSAIAAAFALPMIFAAFPKAATIGAGSMEFETEALIALAGLGAGYFAYVSGWEGGRYAFAAAQGIGCGYVSHKARQWGAAWFSKK